MKTTNIGVLIAPALLLSSGTTTAVSMQVFRAGRARRTRATSTSFASTAGPPRSKRGTGWSASPRTLTLPHDAGTLRRGETGAREVRRPESRPFVARPASRLVRPHALLPMAPRRCAGGVSGVRGTVAGLELEARDEKSVQLVIGRDSARLLLPEARDRQREIEREEPAKRELHPGAPEFRRLNVESRLYPPAPTRRPRSSSAF